MTETLAHGYSSEITQRELSNEYQHGRVKMVSKMFLRLCALDESSLSIGRVKDDCTSLIFIFGCVISCRTYLKKL